MLRHMRRAQLCKHKFVGWHGMGNRLQGLTAQILHNFGRLFTGTSMCHACCVSRSTLANFQRSWCTSTTRPLRAHWSTRWLQLRAIAGQRCNEIVQAGLHTHTEPSPLLPALADIDHPEVSQLAASLDTIAMDQPRLETVQYWLRVLARIDHPEAKRLIPQVDLSHPLGLRPEFQKDKVKAAAAASRSRRKRVVRETLYNFFLNVKQQHPTKVLLVRVGEFYETMGLDAVLLVQWAALRPMGSGRPPKAGCRVSNIRRTLRDLLEQGLSVVVCEEAPEDYLMRLRQPKSMRQQGKQRYIAGIVTPANPNYMVGLMDDDQDDGYQSMPPLLGVAMGVSGFKLVEVDIALRTCCVTEGLTGDSVISRLHDGGMVPPLYLHASAALGHNRQQREGSPEYEWEARLRQLMRYGNPLVGNRTDLLRRYEGPDPVSDMLEAVRLDNCLDPDTVFDLVTNNVQGRPKPLYHSTACNLGLHRTPGVPSLLNAVLPPESADVIKGWMRKLLLSPPTPLVANAIRHTCRAMAELNAPLPVYPLLQPGRLVLRLQSQEADDKLYRELYEQARAVHDTLTRQELAELSRSLLPCVSHEVKRHLDALMLVEACEFCMSAIEDIVELSPDDEVFQPPEDVDDDEDDNSDSEEGDELAQAQEMAGMAAVMELLLPKLTRLHEGFRNKVVAKQVGNLYEEVKAARQKVLEEAVQALQIARSIEKLGRHKPYLTVDHANKTLWLRQGSIGANIAEMHGLIRPKDRNHRPVSKFFSTPALEDAQAEYRALCQEAQAAVKQELKKLALQLQVKLQELVGVATFAIVSSALHKHVAVAINSGWNQTEQLEVPPEGQRQPFEVVDLYPYWLPKAAATTTCNSFSMEGMFILTGPNMAGKSTLLRSVCALSVLSACGLYAPVRSAVVPYIDAFMLRTFSSDSPVEGKSSFAMEMSEMRSLMEEATQHTLALVDELGKGTEVKAGTAIAGSMLERLTTVGCRGVFATHLHALRQLPLELPGAQWMQMGTEEHSDPITGVTWHRPTNRMVPGYSSSSLALQVASDQGVPLDVLCRANELLQTLDMGQLLSANPIMRPTSSTVDGLLSNSNALTPTLPTNGAAAAAPVNGYGVLGIASGKTAEGGEGPTIREALQVLQAVANKVSVSLEEPEALTNGDGLEATAGVKEQLPDDQSSIEDPLSSRLVGSEGHLLFPGQQPPPSLTGCSCVYVVRRPKDNSYYCGQTDSLHQRLTTHGRRTSKVAGGKLMEACYIRVASTAVAKAVEARAIQALQEGGFRLISVTDARSTKLPKAKAAA